MISCKWQTLVISRHRLP